MNDSLEMCTLNLTTKSEVANLFIIRNVVIKDEPLLHADLALVKDHSKVLISYV